ncbi:LOW QUALITY PROTEIN: ABC transporter G family member 42-like [Phalaenopsis equestris]|uniref:LOW QUALITY PROTEIN: ABC transporter G family member 42-like n=1 Tax=Phalaenopsis equestris TaxID=78828 RepID=UPI0009E5EAAA|nr:LOW QUALITY PROTEIN: ABC transporter G family member 42-like [Phalaenopsis equestris]
MSSRATSEENGGEDEKKLFASLMRLPTLQQLRTAILKSAARRGGAWGRGDCGGGGGDMEKRKLHELKLVDVRKLTNGQHREFVEQAFKVAEEDNERFLRKLRERILQVGIQLPTVEVRFEKLNVEGECYVGKRALPTLLNTAINVADLVLSKIGASLTKHNKLSILKDVSGVVRPSRMTLLLGPPASGKTTLLQVLAGNLNSSLKASGEVTYNGYKFDEFVPQKSRHTLEAAYIGEKDVHVPALTVRETLDFSAKCQGVRAADYELLKELSKREKAAGILPDAEIDLFMKATSVEGVKHSLQTEYIIKILGLDLCADTLVGDQMRRGISGGQKKRLTTGEVIVGQTKVLFMDETSTGLDSSTTYQIVKCLQQIVHLGEATILMSLLQPTPETFNLFDDIILLSEGQIVYQGPREYILDFFEFCGFRCPERKSTPDFLQEVISHKDQAQYWAGHTQPHRYITTQEFDDHFYQFHIGLHLKNELLVPFDKTRNHHAALVFKKHVVPFSELLTSSFAKEWLLLRRNLFLHVFKFIQIILMAIIVSTVFLRTRTQAYTISDAFFYNGALLFGMVCNIFNGFLEVPTTIARLPTFYKQRDLLFYPAWTFTLPLVFLRIPISVLESTIYVAITYYTIGFAPEASRFFKQLLAVFLIQQVAFGLFRTIAGLCRAIVISGFAGTLSIFFFFNVGGLFLSKDLIPKLWMWGYWVSPFTYGYTALTVNEFLAPRWMNKSALSESIGLEVLETIGVFPEKKWYWLGIGALSGFAILFNVVFTLALTYLGPIETPQSVISEAEASSLEANIEMRRTAKIMIVDTDNDSSPQALPTNDEDNKREIMGLQKKGHSFESVDASNSYLSKKGMVLPFTPLTVSFHDVNYFIDMPRHIKNHGKVVDRIQLLKDITGAFRPGNLTALMGVSGAGKTTLMDILAGRKNIGNIEGDIRISGYPKNQATFTRVLGYCEQNDIHSPQITVNESLLYSAFLRLSMNFNNEEKKKFIDEVMELVELTNLKDAIVGLPGVSGLSTEQRKRLTVAVELVANPSVIFMDEPTTGLDAKAAAIVMRTVRNIVGTGRTIVCTIHQPSIDIFESFDELLLLKRGGQIIYSGPLGQNSQKLIEYFEEIPGVPKIKEKENPATWMLAITSSVAKDDKKIDFADYYQSSSLYELNKELVTELSEPAPESEDLYFPSKYSQTIYTQFRICFWKHWWTYWRSPHYSLVRLFFTFVTSLFLGSISWKIGQKRDNANDLRIILGYMVISSQFIGISNCSNVQPVVATERTVFYRERGAGMYSAVPYAIAHVVVEIPYIIFQSLQFTTVVYSMMSFEWTAEKFFWFFFITFSTFLYFTYYGMMTVSISPNHQMAAILSSAFYAIFTLFSGFYIPKSMIPKWWIWYYWICPLAWTVYGLIVSQFGDVDALIRVPGQADRPINLYVKEHFGYDRDMLGVVGVVLVSFSVLFAFIFVFCIRSLNFQRR